MTQPNAITRRKFGLGSAALAASSALLSMPVAAEVNADDWKQLIALYNRAKTLGINLPSLSAPASGTAEFRDIVPAIVDFKDHLDDAQLSGPAAKELDDILAKTRALLNAINLKERNPRQGLLPGLKETVLGLMFAPPAYAADATQAKYLKYRDGYIQLFNSCVIAPGKQSSVDWYVDKLTSPKYRAAYEKVEEIVCVPWYFIGCIHALETSFNFEAHLHNGDPLNKKTVHVPKGRPDPWLPPSDWQSSAQDALDYENFTHHQDWNLAKLLFRLEAYNGFRSREEHGINTPYLWCFSNHYTKGKFVADNVWSSTAVSQQCGAAVMIKEMVNRKVVVPVA